ncbi:MAG: NHL repeat-containing protein [Candidatus Latescibacterota bacterium]
MPGTETQEVVMVCRKKRSRIRYLAVDGRRGVRWAHRLPQRVPDVSFYASLRSFLLALLLVFLLASHSDALLASLQFGGKGDAPGQFGAEIHLDVDEAGRMFVSDTDNRRIQIFDSGGGLLHLLADSEKPVPSKPIGEAFRFEEPRAIAVGPDGRFYVADWQTVSLSRGEDPPLYFCTPIVHRFDAERRYQGFVQIDSQGRDLPAGERLVPVVDREGRAAYLLKGDHLRPLHLAAGPDGDLYVLDERRNKIVRYDPNGVRKGESGGFGQLDRAASLTVDGRGNVYVSDRGHHRVVRFDENGEATALIGRRGRRDGEFLSPYLVRWVATPHFPLTGQLLVKDESAFPKVFQSMVGRRPDDPQSPIMMAEDPEDGDQPGYKRYRQWFGRVQAFDSDGNFRKKTVLRFSEQDHETGRKVVALGRNGALCLFDREQHQIEVVLPEPALGWHAMKKTYRLLVKQELEKSLLDAAEDLDLDPDYRADLDFRFISQSLRFQADVTERLGFSWEGTTLFLGGYRDRLFPGEELPPDLPEQEGRYVHDNFMVEDVVRGDLKMGVEVVLNSDPFDPRRIKGFFELGGITYDFRYETSTRNNKAHAVQDLWGWNVGLGMDWDIRRDLNGFLHVSYDSPESLMNYRYRYWDESGDLVATSSVWGRKWTVYTGLYAAF